MYFYGDYMKKTGIILFSFLFASCMSYEDIKETIPSEVRNAQMSLGGLKIGILGDSQIQTSKETAFVPLLNGEIEDAVVDVSLRIPPLNEYSSLMLRYFIEQLISREEVDVIFYLGDAANNGCRDELERVFEILEEYQNGTKGTFVKKPLRKIPIFFLPGNHDYLGAGNIYFKNNRQKLCSCDDENPAILMSKCDVILKASEFNKKNTFFTGWKYRDNVDEKSIKESCNRGNEGGFIDALRGRKIDDMRKPYCFLAGELANSELKGRIILLDTSDYYGKWFVPAEKFIKRSWYGVTGWVSEEQIMFLDSLKKQGGDGDITIIASHYPLTDLAVSNEYANNKLITSIIDKFKSGPDSDIFWLSAHTHAKYSLGRVSVNGSRNGKIVFDHLNVGSTTDSYRNKDEKYPPHAAAFNIVSRKDAIDVQNKSRINLSVVKLDRDEKLFNQVIGNVNSEADNTAGEYEPYHKSIGVKVETISKGNGLFGLKQRHVIFEKENEYYDYIKVCRNNLDRLVDNLHKKSGITDKNLIKLYIGFYAADVEKDKSSSYLSRFLRFLKITD